MFSTRLPLVSFFLDAKALRSIGLWHLALLFLAAFVAFLAGNIPAPAIEFVLHALNPKVENIRAAFDPVFGLRKIAYVFSAVVIVGYLLGSLSGKASRFWDARVFFIALAVFVFLLFLFQVPNLASMGADYGRASMDPYWQPRNWFYRRLFLPALAHALELKGAIYFNVFHRCITFVAIYLTILWASRICRLRLWHWLAIFSGSYVAFHFQFPGYVDVGVYVIGLLAWLGRSSLRGRIAAFILMLMTHESAAVLIGLPMLLARGHWRDSLYYLIFVGLFGFSWVAGYGFDIVDMFLGHTQLNEDYNNIDYMLENKRLVPVGAFFAYKLLWIPIIYACVHAYKAGKYHVLRIVLLILLLPFTIIWLVDVSRDISWGFFGAIICLVFAYARMKRVWFHVLLMLHLLIPSLYVGTNTGVLLRPGIYATLYQRWFTVHR